MTDWYVREKSGNIPKHIHALDIIMYTYHKLRLHTSYVFLYVSFYSVAYRMNSLSYVLKNMNLPDNNAALFDRPPK